MNESIQSVDLSCNNVTESNAATLKDSLEGNQNITSIDVRQNELSKETVDEINEIVTKNHLKQQGITYYKVPNDCKYLFSCNSLL